MTERNKVDSKPYIIPHDPSCSHCTKSTYGIVVKNMCVVHRRLARMIMGSIVRGMPCPPMDEMEKMIPDGMVCGDCGCEMIPYVPAGQDATRRMVIQHYRSGDIAIVCHSCNSRHARLPGDKFLEVGPDEKWCRRCDRILKLDGFYKNSASTGYKGASSYCKECLAKCAYHTKEENKPKIRAYRAVWRDANREGIREYMRAYKAANRERIAESNAKSAKKCRAKINARRKLWRAKRREMGLPYV